MVRTYLDALGNLVELVLERQPLVLDARPALQVRDGQALQFVDIAIFGFRLGRHAGRDENVQDIVRCEKRLSLIHI